MRHDIAREAERSRGVRVQAGTVSLLAGTLICVGKFAAWGLTGSAAVLSDALESVVNVVAAALLLYSLVVASRPADLDHPYGHGKVEFFSAGLEGGLILVAAVLILLEAAREIVAGPALARIDLGMALIAGLTVANALLGLFLVRVGRRENSLALVADGQHILTDVITSVGVLVGLGAVWLTGWALLDPLVAIVLALNILRTGWKLARDAVGGLMDEADLQTLQAMVEGLERKRRPWWIGLHGLRAWRTAQVQHADLHMIVPRYFDADRLHDVDLEIGSALLADAGTPGDVIVHFDPCRPRHCSGCAMADCAVRAAPVVAVRPFTLERAILADEPPAGAAAGAAAP